VSCKAFKLPKTAVTARVKSLCGLIFDLRKDVPPFGRSG
jgi:hypothetical protein